MSVSAFRDSDESQRGFLGVLLRAGAVNIADRDDDIRRHAAKEAYSSDDRQRCQYVDALNLLRPTELLQEEFQFLASEQQPRRDPGRISNNINNDDDDSDDADTISTSLTGMHLENGRAQRLGHLKKIRNTFDRHNESPAQPLPDRKNRSRGCRGGRGAPQKPDEDLLRSLQDDSRAVDPSDMTSDPGTPRSYGFGARPNAGNRQDNLARPSTPNTNRRANAPSPVTPSTNNNNNNNNVLRTRPTTPSGGDGIFNPAPSAAKRMRSLQRQRAAVMENYKEALKALTHNDVRMREIDAEMRLLGAGVEVLEEEIEEELNAWGR